MKRLYFILILIALLLEGISNENALKVEPPFWWVGMNNPSLQLMVHGDNIAGCAVETNNENLIVKSVISLDNPNYLFVNLELKAGLKAGDVMLSFNKKNKQLAKYTYSLKERIKDSAGRIGFNTSDVIYLITPDRFANGNPENDNMKEMKDSLNRADYNGRHGGDIQGIIDHLDYIQEMGFTAVWLNPVLENNMSQVSYHGYSTTDFYKVDPRYGSNEEYLQLKSELEKRDMKLIMDMIFNHCGSEHWWMKDMPAKDWINFYPDYKITNHMRTVNQDPYASQFDKKMMTDGWFVPTMPDLNQNNPYMLTYLIQNAIWWTEYAGLDGIRMDTYPYPDKLAMAEWTKRMIAEYPNFNMVGEEWSMNPATVAYWQRGKINSDGYVSELPSLMDFPLQNAVAKALTEKEDWGTGLIKIYETLSNDYQYADAFNLVTLPDNHDMSRIFTQLKEDKKNLKLALAFFLTSRGIPQVFYGTEILMENPGTNEHGVIRSDFPGGWLGDEINAFTGEGLSDDQKEIQEYVKNIQNWRKHARLIHNGALKHYVPENGVYVYFRYNTESSVMVILNKNNEQKLLDTSRFSESICGFDKGIDIISGDKISDLKMIEVPSGSAMIIELK